MHPPANQIPFLDGLRSLAILLVVSGHASKLFSDSYGATLYSRLPFVANGWIGVDLFFVLSGFFIGGQLWKELRARGTVSVPRFMLRRGFRIWPLYYFVFLCVLAVSGSAAAGRSYGWSDLVFLTNYLNHGLVMGSWSLCTEEQFYIVAPLALYFLARNTRRIERCRPWLIALLCLVPTVRAVLWVVTTGHVFEHNPALFQPIYYSSVTHCDGLIMGLLIANLWTTRTQKAPKLAHPWLLIAMAIAALAGFHVLQKEIFDFTALALFFGAAVWVGLHHTIRIFQMKLFYWISRLSFGMYLNHEYIGPWIVGKLLPHLQFAHVHVLSNLEAVALLTISSMAVALVTFCFVEYPFLQIRTMVLKGRAPLPVPADASAAA